ncbi:MAG: YaiI/YqxD family protein [Candidatus Rariloculaceae bacterium]
MEIWVDADACPVVIKEILFRAAKRTGIQITLVANQPLATPKIPSVRMVQVPSGFDVADNEIVKRCVAGDLVITSDIPLAAEVIEKGADALSPRGELYSSDDIRARLNMRDFMDTLRASGINTGGPAAISQSDRQQFANNLDTMITRGFDSRPH